MRRLRLVKVAVQPTFVVDDGDTLTEVQGHAVAVTAANWPSFAADAFTEDELVKLLATLDAQEAPDPPG